MNTIKLIGILVLAITMTACGQTVEKKTKIIEGWKSLSENNYSI